MQKVKTDTTVVPQGVVAAMKALREKEGNTEGKTIKILCTNRARNLKNPLVAFWRPTGEI